MAGSYNQHATQVNRRRTEYNNTLEHIPKMYEEEPVKRPVSTGFRPPFDPYDPSTKETVMENQTHAITILNPQQAISQVTALREIMLNLRKNMLVENLDYGKIPGTGDKPTLLLPGMEKLMRALNAVPRYVEKRVITNYDEDKPLFHYEYECQLIDADTGQFIPGGIGIGLCTSMESSFRWRKAERKCPHCEEPAVIKGKEEYGGGWLCYKNKGGCGAKWKDGDSVIEGQVIGRVPNPDIFDQVNAICKRAQKRALASAVKGAAAVSEFFTVDLEDFIEAEFTPNEPTPEPSRAPAKETKPEAPARPKADKPPQTNGDRGALHKAVADVYDNEKHRMNSINAMFESGELKDDMPLVEQIETVLQHRARGLTPSAKDVLKQLEGKTIRALLDAGTSAKDVWDMLNDVAF